MRALFLTGTLGYGGAEGHSISLVNRLAARGHECHAAYIKAGQGAFESRLSGAASVRGLGVTRYVDLAAIDSLAAHLERLRPTVVVAANPYALLYARLALYRSSVAAPLAVTFHTTVLAGTKEWLQMLGYRPLFWTADCLIFVCEAQRSYWRRRGLWARRSEVIHNGVDVAHWRPPSPAQQAASRRALGLAAEDFVVGLCGRFRPQKNHVQLVDAIGALRARGIPARALLIGDGPTRPVIERRARRAGVAAHVLITGLQGDVRPLLGACDVAVLCSLAETFSIAALEAMALARPMVHAEVGGGGEIVQPGENGFLFPVGDTRALVERLAALTPREVRTRMGAAARETVETRFSERAMLDRYEAVLVQLESARSKHENLRRSAGVH